MRSDSADAKRLLERALAKHHVEGLHAPANYSVQLAGADGGAGGRRMHFLHRGATQAVRSRDPRRVVTALVRALSSHRERDDERIRVAALALVGPRGAVVVPWGVSSRLDRIERRLNASGIRVIDLPFVDLDPAGPAVVVSEPALEIDAAALDDLAAASGLPTRADAPVAAGRYPLVGWTFLVPPGTALSLPERILHAATALLDPTRPGAQATLEAVAAAMRTVAVADVAWDELDRLPTLLEDIA